ncbi:MAG: hypothetical protein Q4C70_03470 [Planctomycetia bacterium]|nr:hypothetical protein [Planctomycetia bacterium]
MKKRGHWKPEREPIQEAEPTQVLQFPACGMKRELRVLRVPFPN